MPPAADALRGVRAKIKWTEPHFAKFELAKKLLADANHDLIGRDRDTKPGKTIFRLNRDPVIPADFALIAGDIVHDLRCALDYLAFALCQKAGRTIKDGTLKQVYFPFADEPKKYMTGTSVIESLIKPAAAKAIRAVEAYQGGIGHRLWQLNELANIDKHRLLLTIGLQGGFDAGGYQHARMRASLPPEIAAAMDGINPDPLILFSADPTPLKAGHEVLILDAEDAELDQYVKLVLPIAIDEPKIGQPQSLIDLLKEMANTVSGVVDRFGDDCFWP